jgi:hypothetical protein
VDIAFWPISEVAARPIEVRSVGDCVAKLKNMPQQNSRESEFIARLG